MYIDRLMEQEHDLDWGICGVGMLPQDTAMRDAMRAQDCLYTLVLRHPDGSHEPRVIGSELEYLFSPTDHATVFERLEDPAVRIVTLTVTEGGYLKDPATGAFAPEHPSVTHDLGHPRQPSTAFGFIVEALRRRRAAGVSPFAVLSCDNLQGNGLIASQTVTELARLSDPGLAAWIESMVSFPNCMVDRITPATTEADRKGVSREFGIDDRVPVPGEPFTQWIVEDDFPSGRPPLERVGVQFVEDVKPYELMKLRMLNASHQAIAYFGAPSGYVFVDEAMNDPRIRDYLMKYMISEAIPTLGEIEGIDLTAYVATLIDRFGNPAIRDSLVRLATDGSNRMPTFTVPTIRANLDAGRPFYLATAMVAAWAEFWAMIARGELPESKIPPDDRAAELMAAAIDPSLCAFIENRALFGDLADHAGFRESFSTARVSLQECGVDATLDHLIG